MRRACNAGTVGASTAGCSKRTARVLDRAVCLDGNYADRGGEVTVGIFGSKQAPAPSAEFDGVAGAQELERLVDRLLECAARGRTDGILDTAQQIFLAKPTNPRALVSADFLEEPWKWMMAVAKRAARDGNRVFPAKIGLMCQLWNRVVLADEPRYQMGRLVEAPSDVELGLYRLALAALVTMERMEVLIPGGDRGWVAVEALEQISQTVRALISQGVTVDPELRGLATGDPATVAAARGSAGPVAESDSGRAMEELREFKDMAEQARQTGDVAGQIYARGVAFGVKGDEREALRNFEEAARLGHVDAMYNAGCTANRLGDMSTARFWWEAAANAGHGRAAQNMAASEAQAGRLDKARPWFLRAAELGNPDGFAALTQMASDADDGAEEMRWARAGAEAGHPFCMTRFGLLTIRFHGDDPQAVRRALPYLERAGEQGDPEAMFLAGLGHNGVGDRYEAGHWLRRAEQAGYPRAREALNQFRL
jgi:TPR repeat protein